MIGFKYSGPSVSVICLMAEAGYIFIQSVKFVSEGFIVFDYLRKGVYCRLFIVGIMKKYAGAR